MYLDENMVLQKIKNLSDITSNENDPKLATTIEIIIDEVKNFCNRKHEKSLPKRLENTIVQMTLEYLRLNSCGIKEFEKKNIKGITRGDTKLEYATSDPLDITTFIEGYQSKLMPFRLLKIR
jgi:hypothetical protein